MDIQSRLIRITKPKFSLLLPNTPASSEGLSSSRVLHPAADRNCSHSITRRSLSPARCISVGFYTEPVLFYRGVVFIQPVCDGWREFSKLRKYRVTARGVILYIVRERLCRLPLSVKVVIVVAYLYDRGFQCFSSMSVPDKSVRML